MTNSKLFKLNLVANTVMSLLWLIIGAPTIGQANLVIASLMLYALCLF